LEFWQKNIQPKIEEGLKEARRLWEAFKEWAIPVLKKMRKRGEELFEKVKQWFRVYSAKYPKVFKGIYICIGLFFLFLLLDFISPLPKQKSYSTTIMASDSTLLCAYLTPDDKWRIETSLERVSPNMIQAIMIKEDKWFFYHFGINPLAIGRAVLSNLLSGKRVSGASTISMQLARMSAPASRTYFNKGREMFRALQYEWHYTKEEILEMYLSYLPFGGNVEGVESASYIYFNRPASKLSLSQAILLAIIPNRPNSLRLDRHAESAESSRNWWIGYYGKYKSFSPELLEAAKDEPVPAGRFEIAPQTPHLCQYIRERFHDKNEVYTTLKMQPQKMVEQLLANHVKRMKPIGVSNGAVLVVDNNTKSVIAYCGSADFNDDAAQGQVNGIRGIRSPGSTLKPAVYGLCFDRGLLTPKMKVMDVPTNLHGFMPENYDRNFRGAVTVHDALTHSLNIPVYRLVQELGLDDFLDLMEVGEFRTIRSKRADLGLSAVLGGCGVTLEELTRFYTSFANKGEMFPLNYTLEQQKDERSSISLFSEGTAYLISQILSDIERPDLPKRYLETSRLPKVAWKTGTSYGRRDAWSIGFSPRYTVGVWMGNFDGTGVPELTGSTMAVPLLLEVFNSIDYNASKDWLKRPKTVERRKVCAESGHLPGRHCSQFTTDLYLPLASPLNSCKLHKEVYVKQDESLQYCPICLPDSGYKVELYPIYEPELVLWYDLNEVSIRKPPMHNPKCEGKFSGKGPSIISPSEDFEYYIEKGNEQEVLLQAASGPTVTMHYWYVNGKFYKKALPTEKVFYKPKAGKLKVSCLDDKGRRSTTAVIIKLY